ncbi:MAG: TatD family hydrolase [Methanoregula sp.]|nr:MAG: TatD family hydrolase [Methanoregula sp.]
MKSNTFPITDDHIHIDVKNGRGIEAAKDFLRAGGTHIFLVSKPSWSHGVFPSAGSDFAPVFEETVRTGQMISELGIKVFPVLGVHPAEISRIGERLGTEAAAGVMKEGLSLAARYVSEGRAYALKSGRPHYETTPEILAASNDVLDYALELAKEYDCALQVHAESGTCDDIVGMAQRAGMSPDRVVKHYAIPETRLMPSFIAKHEAIPMLCRERRKFTMESDYMDENSRPGAVIGPKSVPRFTKKLLVQGLISEEDCHRIHTETVERVYRVPIHLS